MMDYSPSMFTSQQVPVIGWNMESPLTGPPKPRVILPRIVSSHAASPDERYINWGTYGRKRKIRKTAQSDVTETPEKPAQTEEFDFSDDDDLLSQVPLNTSSHQVPLNTPSPLRVQSNIANFKTPTTLNKYQTSDVHDVIMPRKLTDEFASGSDDDEFWEGLDDDALLLAGAEMMENSSFVSRLSETTPNTNLSRSTSCSSAAKSCTSVTGPCNKKPCTTAVKQSNLNTKLSASNNPPLSPLHVPANSTKQNTADNSVLDLLQDIDFSDFSDDDMLDEDLSNVIIPEQCEEVETPRRKNKRLSLRKS